MSTPSKVEENARAFERRQTITVEEAAVALGIGRGTAYEGVRTGAIPALRVGRRLLVPVAALDRLLAAGAPITDDTNGAAA